MRIGRTMQHSYTFPVERCSPYVAREMLKLPIRPSRYAMRLTRFIPILFLLALTPECATTTTATTWGEHPWCPEIHHQGSNGFSKVEVQNPAEARATGDLAICPIVIRRADVSDELATNALADHQPDPSNSKPIISSTLR
jgi:hypothetical protein